MSDTRSVVFSGGMPTFSKMKAKAAKAKAYLSNARKRLSDKAAKIHKAMKKTATRVKNRLRKMMTFDQAKAGSPVVLDVSKHPEATGAQTALELLNGKREKKGLPAIKLQKIVSATVLGSIQETTYAMCMEGSVGDENPFHFALELILGEPNRLHHVRPRNVLDPKAKAVHFFCESKVSWGIRACAPCMHTYLYAALYCKFLVVLGARD